MTEIRKNSQIEIMSPVGSFEAINSAIEAGADSVYFGVGKLNMRSAMNVSFSSDDLEKISEICQQHKVKSYLTINTVLYNDDIEDMKALVDKAKENNISAIIACDHSVLNYCKKVGIPIHISTQANVTNIEAVEYYSAFADTIVLGRELSLEKISEITRQIREREIKGPSGGLVRIEIFVHGYFCMAISGKCYLSLDLYNSSANRGECRVPCQRRYLVIDQENGKELLIDNEYVLSAKDLCTIDFIDKIIDSGATVLKIEGRKKGSDYVYTATKCYREAVHACLNGTYTKEKANAWKQELTTVFNRGFWSGYYLGKKLEDEAWSGEPRPRIVRDKTYVAKCLEYSETSERVRFKLESQSLEKGEELLIVGPTAGVVQTTAEDLKVNNEPVDKVREGEVFSLPVQEVVGANDKLYKVKVETHNSLVALFSKIARGVLGEKGYSKIRQLLS